MTNDAKELADKIEADGLCVLCDYGENYAGHGERKVVPFPPDADRELIVKALRAYASAPEAMAQEECLGKPARYWYDAFQIAEGLRADAERRIAEGKAGDSGRFRWLLAQDASVQDAVLRPPVPLELLESPESWPDLVRAEIDSRLGMNSGGT